jgi:hypothetical protein
VQNNNDSSVSESVKQRHRCVDYGGSRCNGWRNVRNRLESTGSTVKNIVFYNTNGKHTIGIALILLRKMRDLTACKTAQIHAHQLFDLCSTVEKQQVRSGLSELKILVSVVRFRPRPPRVPKKPVHRDGLFALGGCLKHAVSTLPQLGTGYGTL